MAAAGSPPARTCGRVLAMVQRSGGAGAARRLQLAAGGTGLGAAPSTSREGLKDLIKQITTGTDRGKRTSYQQRQRALELLQALEKCNPTSDPIMSPLVSGTWTLLYTAPTDGTGRYLKPEYQDPDHTERWAAEATVDKFAGTEEGPFLARIKPAAFGSVKQTGSTQVIDTNRMKVDNIANFSFFGMPGSLCINGSFEKSPPIPGRGAVRLNVVFDKFVLRVGPLGPITIPLGWIQPKGWVDTTYLDEDLRIGRGDKGSIFVATRPQRRKPQSN